MPTIRLFGHYFRLPMVLLFVAEVVLCSISVYAAGYTTGVGAERLGVGIPLMIAGAVVTGMASMGLYQATFSEGYGAYLLRLFLGFAAAFILLSLVFFWFPTAVVDRELILATGVWAGLLVSANRWIFHLLIDSRAMRRKVLVLGAGEKASALARLVDARTRSSIVGFVPMGSEAIQVDEKRVLSRGKGLRELAVSTGCEEIVIAVAERRNTLPLNELLACKARGIRITDTNTFIEKETGKISLDFLSLGWLIASEGFRYSEKSRMLQRLFDVFAAGGLLLVAAPIMVLTAAAIWIESGFSGPILYRQRRVGENGTTFEVMKFRSMRTDAEGDGKARWATPDDDRVTRVGKWIRKSRIDELPQLFNVLKGEMSFVGPRPERPEFVAELEKRIPFYAERHSVKPGLTGWAQLRYSYGASEEDAAQKLQFDLYYIKNHSFFLDLMILVQTVEVVVFGRGAR